MSKLTINFEAGFSNDKCTIEIDHKEQIQCEGISTDYSIGLAKTLEVEVVEGKHEVTVQVTTRGLQQIISTEVIGTTYLRIWIDEASNLEYEISDQLHYYY